MKKMKALILTGDGINCENETALAFIEQGFETQIFHISQLLNKPELLNEFHVLAFPGGFSFGDEINSGQIMALKVENKLKISLERFRKDRKLIIGICNGFQILVKLGLLPNPDRIRSLTLTHNKQHHFINNWTSVIIEPSVCHWMRGLDNLSFQLPIRHGEGRIVFAGSKEEQNKHYLHLIHNRQIVLRYQSDVNGSYERIAGLTDPSGCILGLMPHPEAATTELLLPDETTKINKTYVGARIFQNAMKYCEENF